MVIFGETEFLNGVITRDASAKIVMVEESRMAEFNKLNADPYVRY